MQFKQDERARLQALLNDSESAVRRIEDAISRYSAMLPIARQAAQKPSEIKKDADDLHQALQTLVRIIADEGNAWGNFKACAADDGLAAPLHHLIEALGPGESEPGEAMARAAAQSASELQPTKGRSRTPDKAERFVLMFQVGAAAREAGVLISRNSAALRQIVEVAFAAANIQADPEHDIRTFLKSFEE